MGYVMLYIILPHSETIVFCMILVVQIVYSKMDGRFILLSCEKPHEPTLVVVFIKQCCNAGQYRELTVADNGC